MPGPSLIPSPVFRALGLIIGLIFLVMAITFGFPDGSDYVMGFAILLVSIRELWQFRLRRVPDHVSRPDQRM